MARDRSRARNLLEFVLARGLFLTARLMPRRMLAPSSRGVGRLLYGILGGRRKVVRDNVRLAYGDDPAAPDADALGRGSLANLCLSFMELARVPRDAERMHRSVSIATPRTLESLRDAVRAEGAILVGAHFGAYEIAGLTLPLLGVPCSTLIRPLDNPYLERWLRHARQRHGQQLVDNRGGARGLVTALGKPGAVATLIDLNRRSGRRAWVTFFGVLAATAPTAAVLAARRDLPVFPVFCRRTQRPLEYSLEIGEPHLPRPQAEREEEVQRLMQETTDGIERRIRESPEQWLWTHRRWKTRPEGESSTR